MRDAHSGDDARAVQDHRGGLHLVEERGSTTEQDRYQVEPDLIEQPPLQALPGDRPAVDADVLLAGDLPRPIDGAPQPIGDERERRLRVGPHPVLRRTVGDHDHRPGAGGGQQGGGRGVGGVGLGGDVADAPRVQRRERGGEQCPRQPATPVRRDDADEAEPGPAWGGPHPDQPGVLAAAVHRDEVGRGVEVAGVDGLVVELLRVVHPAIAAGDVAAQHLIEGTEPVLVGGVGGDGREAGRIPRPA
jgi:hypothetical protein